MSAEQGWLAAFGFYSIVMTLLWFIAGAGKEHAMARLRATHRSWQHALETQSRTVLTLNRMGMEVDRDGNVHALNALDSADVIDLDAVRGPADIRWTE